MLVPEEMTLNRLLPGNEQLEPANVMTECWATLVAAQVAIDELAAVLRIGRSAVGNDSIQISHQLEMAELDLLSAQDALQKACWEADLTAAQNDVRIPEGSVRSTSLPTAPPAGSKVTADTEQATGRRVRHHRRRRAPEHGQGELFPLHHTDDA